MSVRVLSQVEDSFPSHAGAYQPIVNRVEYQVLDVLEDGLSLLTDTGDTKDDLSLPTGTDDLTAVANKIRELYDDGKDFRVVVLCAMGQELVIETKEMVE